MFFGNEGGYFNKRNLHNRGRGRGNIDLDKLKKKREGKRHGPLQSVVNAC